MKQNESLWFDGIRIYHLLIDRFQIQRRLADTAQE